MEKKAIDQLKKLLEEGQRYNYNNFGPKSSFGYPESYSSEYISWKTRLQVLIEKYFGKISPVYQLFLDGTKIYVLGNYPSEFNKAHSYFIGALKTALELIELEDIEIEEEEQKKEVIGSNKVFVVHGHDDKLKHEIELFLNEIGLEPIVLHRQPDKGQTIIEKFENNSNVGYAIILLTPDDIGYPTTEESKDEKDREKKFRARQNVIFEFGYFIGKLGRSRVCCLYKETVELPTDVAGIVYKKVTTSIEDVAYSLIKDLKAVGYQLKV